MYKIQFLLVLHTDWSSYALFGQSTAKRQAPVPEMGTKPYANQGTSVRADGWVFGHARGETLGANQTTRPRSDPVPRRQKPGERKPPTQLVTNEVLTNRQTAFTAHLLADQVEPGKKYDVRLLIEGQKVSLPYPTQFQTQNLWQWRTDPPTFHFGVGSCTYVNEPEVRSARHTLRWGL